MIILLSPAKTMDVETVTPTAESTPPFFLNEAAGLVGELAALSKAKLKKLLKVSDSLADLNYDRYQEWSTDMSVARQAVFTYKGDAYVGLDAFTLDLSELVVAQTRLIILSGLYGVLRPLDAIHPYRLEMGGVFAPSGCPSLLAYWKGKITAHLADRLADDDHPWILNLASKEYSEAVDLAALGVPVVSPQFLENRNGAMKQISSFSKKARGTMARWAIDEGIQDVDGVALFAESGYEYDPKQSSERAPVFVR